MSSYNSGQTEVYCLLDVQDNNFLVCGTKGENNVLNVIDCITD